MDFSKLTTGERIVAGSGVLLLVDSFLPWFRYCLALLSFHRCVSHTAWATPWSTLAMLVVAAMVVQIVLARLTNVELPKPGVSWQQLHLIGGVVVLSFVLIQFLAGDDPLRRSFGIIVGIVLSAGVAAGGYLESREPDAAAGT